MKKVLKKIKILLTNVVIFLISIFVPKSKGIIIIGSWFGKSFSDNSKYLYLYLNKNIEKYNLKKVVWVTSNESVFEDLNDKGFNVVKKGTLKSYWYHLRAEYHFIDQNHLDIDSYFSIRSQRIQLWHGVGFKNISSIDIEPNKNLMYKIKYYLRIITTPGGWYKYIFLSTSNFATKNIFNLSFRLWENKVVESNYPRNIFLLNKDSIKYSDYKVESLINYLKNIKKEKKIILYMPTYRSEANLTNKRKSKSILNLDNKREVAGFIEYLKNNNYYFLNKEHFAGNISDLEESNNFLNLDNDIDVYPILEYTDLLITDYSSIYADYLFLKKPIVFYPYDLEKYKNFDKGFLFDYNLVTPGEKAYVIEELKDKITCSLVDDKFFEERERVKKMYFGENEKINFDDFIKCIIHK